MNYQLLTILRDKLSQQELQDLCFLVGADYQNFPNRDPSEFAKALIGYVQRRNMLTQLVTSGKEIRSDLDWPTL